MKKKLRIVVCLFCCLMLAACSGKEEKKEDAKEAVEIQLTDEQSSMATQFVKDLTQRRYEKLLKDYSYDERMKETIKQKDFQKQLDSYNDSLGKLMEAETPYGQSYQGSTIIMIPCRMEEQNTNIQLSLNEKNEIQGLFFKPYKTQKKRKDPHWRKGDNAEFKDFQW